MKKPWLKVVDPPKFECDNCTLQAIFVIVTDRIRGRYCAPCAIEQLREMSTGVCATVTRLLVSEPTSP